MSELTFVFALVDRNEVRSKNEIHLPPSLYRNISPAVWSLLAILQLPWSCVFLVSNLRSSTPCQIRNSRSGLPVKMCRGLVDHFARRSLAEVALEVAALPDVVEFGGASTGRSVRSWGKEA